MRMKTREHDLNGFFFSIHYSVFNYISALPQRKVDSVALGQIQVLAEGEEVN
jgi:hypothetical protein